LKTRYKCIWAVFLFVFCAFIFAGSARADNSAQYSREIFDEVYSKMEKNYYSEIKEETREKINLIRKESINDKNATKKMLELFECSYIDNTSCGKKKKKSDDGRIGILILPQNDSLLLGDVYPESPAEKSGLKRGHRIVAIDGRSLAGVTFRDAVKSISGKPGTFVELTVRCGNPPTFVKFRIKREKETWETEYVRGKVISPGVGYIEMSSFYFHCGKDFAKAVKHLNGKGVHRWIISLEYNRGGYVFSADRILGEMLPGGAISAHLKRRDKKSKYFVYDKWIKDEAFKIAPKDKIIILVNKWSASASELVASALQDYRRATILGEKTYGKGSVQGAVQLSNDLILMVTKYHFYSPVHKKPVNKVGVTPDVFVVDDYDTEKNEILEAALRIFRQIDEYGEIPLH
jgi:carboxyl-terminal processing protease